MAYLQLRHRVAGELALKLPRVHAGMSHMGIVYEFQLVGIAKDAPLYGVSYIGQAVRSVLKFSTAQSLLDKRAYEHSKAAGYAPKEVGFRKAIELFGIGAFEKRVLHCNVCNEEDCRTWANGHEILEIKNRGGVLKDMDPDDQIQQTFNLVSGGTGNAKHAWERVQALALKRWIVFKEALEAYVAEHGHACPAAREMFRGYTIGKRVSHARSGEYLKDQPERRVFLESLPGWDWAPGSGSTAEAVYYSINPEDRFNSSKFWTAGSSEKLAKTKRSKALSALQLKLEKATPAEASKLQRAFDRLCRDSDARRERLVSGSSTSCEEAREKQSATWRRKRAEKRARMTPEEQIRFDRECERKDRELAKRKAARVQSV